MKKETLAQSVKYVDKLLDSRWQKKRLEIMGRDMFECQKCKTNDNKTLHVHHRHYINGREPWDYPNELLVTLCKDCHKSEEEAVIKADEMLKALHFWGYFNTEIVEVLNKLIERKIQTKKGNAEPNVKRLDGQ